jgi:tetraacyldisaccharide 4'-kinase
MLRRLLSWIFILASRTRLYLYKKGLFKSIKVDARVISIGNISMGGSGKTPMVLKLANEAANRGLRTVLIERGYKGKLSSQIVCAKKGIDAAPDVKIIGDEAKMVWDSLVKGVRMCVSKSKAKGAEASKEKWPDTKIMIIDDGFQHLQLERDVDVVLIDAVSGFDEKVFPHGTLREPYSALKRADIVIFTKADDLSKDDLNELSEKAKEYNPKIKIFFAKTKFYSSVDLNGKKVLPVSAVFNGAHFRKKLKTAGAIFDKYMGYSDHRAFSTNDVKDIYDFKNSVAAQYIALTKKDWAKLERLVPDHNDIVLCWYEHVIDNEEDFIKCCIGS